MYDFLLVINTNLPPILHRFQVTVWLIIGQIFAECLTLSLSLGVTPVNIAKTRFFGLLFRCRKYWRIFNHFYIIRPDRRTAAKN